MKTVILWLSTISIYLYLLFLGRRVFGVGPEMLIEVIFKQGIAQLLHKI